MKRGSNDNSTGNAGASPSYPQYNIPTTLPQHNPNHTASSQERSLWEFFSTLIVSHLAHYTSTNYVPAAQTICYCY